MPINKIPLKHVIIYGPGPAINIICSQSEVDIIEEKISSRMEFTIVFGGSTTWIDGSRCWAMNVTNYEARREGDLPTNANAEDLTAKIF